MAIIDDAGIVSLDEMDELVNTRAGTQRLSLGEQVINSIQGLTIEGKIQFLDRVFAQIGVCGAKPVEAVEFAIGRIGK